MPRRKSRKPFKRASQCDRDSAADHAKVSSGSCKIGPILMPYQVQKAPLSFLDLPLELRQMVYTACGFKGEEFADFTRVPNVEDRPLLNLLRCCMQIRRELLQYWHSPLHIMVDPELPDQVRRALNSRRDTIGGYLAWSWMDEIAQDMGDLESSCAIAKLWHSKHHYWQQLRAFVLLDHLGTVSRLHISYKLDGAAKFASRARRLEAKLEQTIRARGGYGISRKEVPMIREFLRDCRKRWG